METCIPLQRGMLVNPIDVRTGDEQLDFEQARQLANARAREVSEDAMLVAWFDRKEGRFFPAIACGGREKPSWLVYAESRGANLVVDINEETFVFVYLA